MLKTVEIQNPQVADTKPFNGRYVLYEAFQALSSGDIKHYPPWKSHNNNLWKGGLTATASIDTLSDLSLAVLLRENKGVVQLVVARKSVEALDRAEDYKNEGWEFSASDSDIIFDARYYKRGKYKGKIMASFNPVQASGATQLNDDQYFITASLTQRMSYEECKRVVEQVQVIDNIQRQLLISPLWKNYSFGIDGKSISREAPLSNQDLPKGVVKIN